MPCVTVNSTGMHTIILSSAGFANGPGDQDSVPGHIIPKTY